MTLTTPRGPARGPMPATDPPRSRAPHARLRGRCSMMMALSALVLLCTITETYSRLPLFMHSTTGPDGEFFPCTRIPTALAVPGTSVRLAFAECRRWVGDGCEPAGLPTPVHVDVARGIDDKPTSWQNTPSWHTVGEQLRALQTRDLRLPPRVHLQGMPALALPLEDFDRLDLRVDDRADTPLEVPAGYRHHHGYCSFQRQSYCDC